jgi:S-formylglutathione hydrolase FrmB
MRLLLLAPLLLGCRPPAAAPPRPAVTVTIAPGVELLAAPKGQLVVATLSPAEYGDLKAHGATARLLNDLLTSRMQVVGAVDLSKGSVTRDVEVPRGYAVWAWLDVCGEFMATFADRGCVGSLEGFAEPGTQRIVFSRVSKPNTAERCVGERKRLLVINDPTLVGTIGNPPERRLCAHLPKSYETSTRRYPVVYLLAGFMGDHTTRIVGNRVDAIADALTNEADEVILVGVDTVTRAGSTYLVDSPVTGKFEAFFTTAMTARVDGELRTIPQAKSRALVGQSTGGFNAMSMALRHSDVFGVVAAMSPDGLDLASWMLTPAGDAVQPGWLHWMRFEDRVGGPGQFVSYAADWSPDPSAPRGFAWPADLTTGKLIPNVWARWRANSPIELLDKPAVKNLNGRIYITVARDDEFGLHAPALRFSQALTAKGIANTFVTTEGGHFAGGRERQTAALEHCLRAFATP